MALFNSMTVGDLVRAGYSIAEAMADDQELEAHEFTQGSKLLHSMLRLWMADEAGLTVWQTRSRTITTVAGTAEYQLDTAITSIPALEINSAYITQTNGHEQPLTRFSRDDYAARPNKTQTGRCTHFLFRRSIASGDAPVTGALVLWPVPDAIYTVTLEARIKLTNFTNRARVVEFPDYWEDAIKYGLARRLMVERGMAATPKYAEIKADATEFYEIAAAFDNIQDGGIVHFAPATY